MFTPPHPQLRYLPNLVTLGNGISGLAAVLLCSAAVQAGNLERGLYLAFLCIALGVLCDTLDGPLARVLKANDPIGAQLDSLCDGVSFGFATAAVLALALWSLAPLLALLLGSLWLGAVLLRLARFNLTTDTSVPHLYFSGMCSPVAALFLVALLDASHGTVLYPWLPLAAAVLLPLLMLSRIVFADLPKHYLARKRKPWDLLIAALALLVVPASLVTSAFLGVFLLQTLWQHLRGTGRA